MIDGLRHVIRRRVERAVWPGGRALILLYHRIADEPADPYGLCVSPAQFEEHLQTIRTVGHPLPLGDLAHAVRTGIVPDHAVAITFDDGYLDNAEAALPLLEQYDLPATIFATTGPGGRQREFWWDELERVFLHTEPLPEHLELHLSDSVHRWDLSSDAARDRDAEGWHLFDGNAPTRRHAAFHDVYLLLNPLPVPERTAALDQLLAWAGHEAHDIRPSRRTMTPEEMAAVDAGGLVRIEAHTVHHPSLPAQSSGVQREEITTSKRTLEAWLGRPVDGFAYPYGDVDAQSAAIVEEAGFDYACTCTYRSAWRRSDRFLLPRVEAPACSGDRLTELMRWQLR